MNPYNPAHEAQQRAKLRAAGKRNAELAATAMVRCRNRSTLLPVRLAVSL